MRVTRSISFAGCGALNYYQAGVAQALDEGRLLAGSTLLGASAGAGLAVLLADGWAPRQIADAVRGLTAELLLSARLSPTVLQAVAEAFAERFIGPKTHERVSGRVTLSITSLRPLQNLRVSHFESQAELQQALVAACFVPSITRRSVRFRGVACLDGGATDNQPVLDQQTLKVSPFWMDPRADIRPSPLKVGHWEALCLPSAARADALFALGEADARRWCRRAARSGHALSHSAPSA